MLTLSRHYSMNFPSAHLCSSSEARSWLQAAATRPAKLICSAFMSRSSTSKLFHFTKCLLWAFITYIFFKIFSVFDLPPVHNRHLSDGKSFYAETMGKYQ